MRKQKAAVMPKTNIATTKTKWETYDKAIASITAEALRNAYHKQGDELYDIAADTIDMLTKTVDGLYYVLGELTKKLEADNG